MANETMFKFGYPDTLLREYEQWVVLLRPAQVTLGSVVLAAKSQATSFGQLPRAAHAELATVTAELEATLRAEVGYEKLNYLMLMMVDPHVHFHVFPRYEGQKLLGTSRVSDAGWPGPPDLKSAVVLDPADFNALHARLSQNWLICR